LKQNISILIGGVQGEGVVSTGLNLMKTLSSLGYFTYANRNFSSRIKGGNTTLNMNVGVNKAYAVSDKVDIVLAMDEATIEGCTKHLHNEGVLLYDSALKANTEAINSIKAFAIPITTIAKELGAPSMKSTSAIVFLGRLLNMPEEIFIESINLRYKKKGPEVINKNLQILSRIYQQDTISFKGVNLQLAPPREQTSRAVLMGNDAIAIGALVGGCRFVASYPITPASEIMEYLGNQLPNYGGIMLQAEDEIAAVNAIIGASYGGVRSLTATSGPGISLMLEGIGLAGMAEIPIVIVDAQRAGPSTGLPTKHEQSDLFTMYYGGHGEYPSIILTPSTIEECFYETIRALNLADIYQCPVILLSDLTLSLSPQTIEGLDFTKIDIDRGKLLLAVPEEQGKDSFERYSITEDGISQRVIPGAKGGIHHVTGLEHNQVGGPIDSPKNRKSMMEKRMRKTLSLSKGKELIIEAAPNSNNRTLFLTFGSTYGVLKEASKACNATIDIGKIKMLKPLPCKELEAAFNQYESIVIVENNYYGQLSKIIKSELGYHNKIRSVVKYDGNPYSIDELMEEIGGSN